MRDSTGAHALGSDLARDLLSGFGEHREQLTDGVASFCWMSEWAFGVDLVAVATTRAAAGDVPSFLKVAHDRPGGSLGDAGLLGKIPQARIGLG